MTGDLNKNSSQTDKLIIAVTIILFRQKIKAVPTCRSSIRHRADPGTRQSAYR